MKHSPLAAALVGLAFLLLLFLPGQAQAQAAAQRPAGQVLFAKGEAWRTGANGAREALVTGTSVYPGDTLDTVDGVVQVRFTDRGLVALTTHTRFVIDEYAFRGQGQGKGRARGQDKGFFSLVAGGLRAITGLIGKKRHMDYRLYASAAFIGIRGTAYQARLCQGDCPVADGLYVNGNEGLIAVTNDAGEVVLGRGMSAYVRDFRTPPVLIEGFPVPVDAPLFAPAGETPGGGAAGSAFGGTTGDSLNAAQQSMDIVRHSQYWSGELTPLGTHDVPIHGNQSNPGIPQLGPAQGGTIPSWPSASPGQPLPVPIMNSPLTAPQPLGR
jgi:hypothetical protein